MPNPELAPALTQQAANQISLPYDSRDWLLLCSPVGGAFGGFAAYLGDLSTRRRLNTARFDYLDCLCSTGLGAAAGVGSNFVLLLSPIVSSFKGTAFALFSISLSTMFGLFAERFVPAIQRNIETRLGLTETKLDAVTGKIERTQSSLSTVEDDVKAVKSEVETVLSSADILREIHRAMAATSVPSRVDRAIKAAKAFLQENPNQHLIYMELAKLQFEKERSKPAALETLSRHIRDLEGLRHKQGHDADYVAELSDAYYDRACYRLAPPGPAGNTQGVYEPLEEEIKEALKDLARSIELMPESTIADAEKDVDFDPIRGRDDFKSLMMRKVRP